MRGIILVVIATLVSFTFAAPAAMADGGDVCVTVPGPDPHKGEGDVCVATLDTPNVPDVPPICWYDPHPPHQTCLS